MIEISGVVLSADQLRTVETAVLRRNRREVRRALEVLGDRGHQEGQEFRAMLVEISETLDEELATREKRFAAAPSHRPDSPPTASAAVYDG